MMGRRNERCLSALPTASAIWAARASCRLRTNWIGRSSWVRSANTLAKPMRSGLMTNATGPRRLARCAARQVGHLLHLLARQLGPSLGNVDDLGVGRHVGLAELPLDGGHLLVGEPQCDGPRLVCRPADFRISEACRSRFSA